MNHYTRGGKDAAFPAIDSTEESLFFLALCAWAEIVVPVLGVRGPQERGSRGGPCWANIS